jgi:hypothetical protein
MNKGVYSLAELLLLLHMAETVSMVYLTVQNIFSIVYLTLHEVFSNIYMMQSLQCTRQLNVAR